MKTYLLIVLSCWIFIAALVFSLVILLNCGGLAFLLYAAIVSVVVGVIAGLYLEKEGCK